MSGSPILTVAAIEWKGNLRNKWTSIFAVVFAVLALTIAYTGVHAEGYSGLQSFNRTSASLLNLILYLVPLIAIVMGTLSFSSEKALLDLLVSQPVRRSEVVAGKILGLFCSIVAATIIGFLAAGIVISPMAGTGGLMSYIALALLTEILALIFLNFAAVISLASDRKLKAFGYALFAWFFFLLFYDLAIIGATVMAGEGAAKHILFLGLFGNPVDIVRVASLIIQGNVSIFGAAGAMLMRYLGGAAGSSGLLLGALLVWIIVPFWIALRIIRKQDI